jgi:hypothetical protein
VDQLIENGKLPRKKGSPSARRPRGLAWSLAARLQVKGEMRVVGVAADGSAVGDAGGEERLWLATLYVVYLDGRLMGNIQARAYSSFQAGERLVKGGLRPRLSGVASRN